MDKERIAYLRQWDAIHGLDTLNWDAAQRITNWDQIRDALHEALNEIERLEQQRQDDIYEAWSNDRN